MPDIAIPNPNCVSCDIRWRKPEEWTQLVWPENMASFTILLHVNELISVETHQAKSTEMLRAWKRIEWVRFAIISVKVHLF